MSIILLIWDRVTPNFNTCYQVRAYAVSVLERADDEELQCYLLQLVQALRFERSDKSRLSHFLVQRGMWTDTIFMYIRTCTYLHATCNVFLWSVCMHVQVLHTSVLHSIRSLIVHGILIVSLTLTALRNIELASFLRWYVAVELHDPAYAKRFYCTYELLEENMMKVRVYELLSWGHLLCLFFLEYKSGSNSWRKSNKNWCNFDTLK